MVATAGDASGGTVVTVIQSAGLVIVTPAADTVARGDTLRLVAEAFDGNGHSVAGAQFAWSSSDASLATVDASGLVRGVAEGPVVIAATAGQAFGESAITVANPDRAALVALYNATGGPNWRDNTNWLTRAPLAEWYGVDTDTDGLVIELDLSHNALTGSIPPELGNLSRVEELRLYSNVLTGPIPRELGNLVGLRTLSLHFNRLNGSIPSELGNLTSLINLSLTGNELSDPIPRTLLALPLSTLAFKGNYGLCAPENSEFVAWLARFAYWSGPLCNDADRAALTSLFESAGGTSWTNADGWNDTAVPGDLCRQRRPNCEWSDAAVLSNWYGVSVDSLGRVTDLDLTRNGLSGRLPPSLGDLHELRTFRIGANALAGPLPRSLSRLTLVDLHYGDTKLCAPADVSFRHWLNSIPSHEGTGVECAAASDRDILVALYEATNGPNWTNAENWLTDIPLGEWYGVRADESDRVVELHLAWNNLDGFMPDELGLLASLERLSLRGNRLAGAIPPPLADLAHLKTLDLSRNSLTGPIPRELGNLVGLTSLRLDRLVRGGPIPPELGNLASLETLTLSGSGHTGPLPPELGNLTGLTLLDIGRNDISLGGPIPPETRQPRQLAALVTNWKCLHRPNSAGTRQPY